MLFKWTRQLGNNEETKLPVHVIVLVFYIVRLVYNQLGVGLDKVAYKAVCQRKMHEG